MTDPKDMDVVDLLTHQHDRIRAMIDGVEKTQDNEARQEKFEELRRFLAVHETAEELVTHPARAWPTAATTSWTPGWRRRPSRRRCWPSSTA